MEYSTRQISSKAKEFFKLDIHKTNPYVISYVYFMPMEFLKLYIIKELHASFHSVLPWSPLWGKLVKRMWSPWNLLSFKNSSFQNKNIELYFQNQNCLSTLVGPKKGFEPYPFLKKSPAYPKRIQRPQGAQFETIRNN